MQLIVCPLYNLHQFILSLAHCFVFVFGFLFLNFLFFSCQKRVYNFILSCTQTNTYGNSISHFFRRKILGLIAPTEAYGFASCIVSGVVISREHDVTAEQLTMPGGTPLAMKHIISGYY
jgi:hypothetical protein